MGLRCPVANTGCSGSVLASVHVLTRDEGEDRGIDGTRVIGIGAHPEHSAG
jgi:hypothetical protein